MFTKAIQSSCQLHINLRIVTISTKEQKSKVFFIATYMIILTVFPPKTAVYHVINVL